MSSGTSQLTHAHCGSLPSLRPPSLSPGVSNSILGTGCPTPHRCLFLTPLSQHSPVNVNHMQSTTRQRICKYLKVTGSGDTFDRKVSRSVLAPQNMMHDQEYLQPSPTDIHRQPGFCSPSEKKRPKNQADSKNSLSYPRVSAALWPHSDVGTHLSMGLVKMAFYRGN